MCVLCLSQLDAGVRLCWRCRRDWELTCHVCGRAEDDVWEGICGDCGALDEAEVVVVRNARLARVCEVRLPDVFEVPLGYLVTRAVRVVGEGRLRGTPRALDGLWRKLAADGLTEVAGWIELSLKVRGLGDFTVGYMRKLRWGHEL